MKTESWINIEEFMNDLFGRDSVFTEDELKVIKHVTERFKNGTASTLEKVAKEEPPYKMVKDMEEIPYHLAYYRNSFDEMTLDENPTA